MALVLLHIIPSLFTRAATMSSVGEGISGLPPTDEDKI